MVRKRTIGAVVVATAALFAFKDWPLGISFPHEKQDGFVVLSRSLWHTPTSISGEKKVQKWADDRCANAFGGQKLEANLVAPPGGVFIFGHVSVVCRIELLQN